MMMMNFLVGEWRGWRWSDTLAQWLPSKTPMFEATSTNQQTGSFEWTLGHVVAVFVVPKADILNNTAGEVVFVATKPDILS